MKNRMISFFICWVPIALVSSSYSPGQDRKGLRYLEEYRFPHSPARSPVASGIKSLSIYSAGSSLEWTDFHPINDEFDDLCEEEGVSRKALERILEAEAKEDEKKYHFFKKWAEGYHAVQKQYENSYYILCSYHKLSCELQLYLYRQLCAVVLADKRSYTFMRVKEGSLKQRRMSQQGEASVIEFLNERCGANKKNLWRVCCDDLKVDGNNYKNVLDRLRQ